MKHVTVFILLMACALSGFGRAAAVLAQTNGKAVDWREELKKAQAHLQKEPKSAFWHNQAGIAYDALGETSNAEKELTLAAKLDSYNPIGYYTLYAFYQRKGTLSQQRKALLNALEIDSGNPLGHFELAGALEKEGYLEESLKEYRTAKRLISGSQRNQYTDARGNPYEIDVVRRKVNSCIDRVTKLESSRPAQK